MIKEVDCEAISIPNADVVNVRYDGDIFDECVYLFLPSDVDIDSLENFVKIEGGVSCGLMSSGLICRLHPFIFDK